jgi:hypothetical protein
MVGQDAKETVQECVSEFISFITRWVAGSRVLLANHNPLRDHILLQRSE